jgi:hypothetical protein
MSFDGAFPTKYQGGARGLYADIIAHYDGSVPAHTSWGFFGQGANADMVNWLWANGYIDVYAFRTDVTVNEDGTINYTVNDTIPPRQEFQMHWCDWVKINVYVDLPQQDEIIAIRDAGGSAPWDADEFMKIQLKFWLYLYATQWNE